jgi:chitin synthase
MPYANTNQYPPGPPRPAPYRDNTGGSGWSAAREKLMKRRSVRQVQLTQGNLVLDVPAPSNIVPGDKTGIEEFSKMRYTAATCDPDDFMSSRYTLRPYLMGRQTELFIVMTMYNEDEVLFVRTMNSYVPSVSF